MRTLLLLIAVFILSAGSVLAQLATTTSLVGNVTDSAGAAIAGAKISAVNTGTGETYTAATNDDGSYNIQFVKIGTYDITATKPGFDSFTKKGILVATNQLIRTDFNMRVGQVSEKVEVTAEVAPIATDEASLSEVINTKRTQDLPLNGRDPLRLAITTPGVLPGLKSPSGNPGGGEDFVAAGVREIQNSVSLDGVSIMNNLITTTTFRPSVDAVQEVLVQTGTYPAQYGGYMGLQMNLVTKSGTNEFHGSLFEFVRNNYFDARGFFNSRPNPQSPFHQNQFGVQLGGPIVIPKVYNGRNRTFFMYSYEGIRQSQSAAQIDTVLTPLMRQGNFSELPSSTVLKNVLAPGAPALTGNIIPSNLLAPQAIKALQYMPLPNLPGIRNNYLASILNANDTNQNIGRLDQSVGQNTKLFFRYGWEDAKLLNGNTNPFNGYNQPVTDRNFVIGYTQVISPTVVNDARFGRQHTTIDSINFFHTPALANAGTDLGIPGFTTNLANSGLPSLGISGFMSIGGQNMASSNWYQTDTTWQGSDLFNFTRGAHSMTAGLEIRKLITLRTANNGPRGVFNFTNLTGNAAADFMLGVVGNVTTPGPLFPGGAVEYRDGFFFMDKWQATSKLTLSLGLRYELPTVAESSNGNGTILDPALTHFIPTTVPKKIPYMNPTHKDFAPRVGLAYRLSSKWVLRGGYGIYYNPNQLNTFTLATTNPPFSTIFTYSSVAPNYLTFANPTPSTAQGSAPTQPGAFTINPNLPTAYMNQWSFDVERALWRNAGLDIQYLGSHSVHLDRSYYINQPQPGPGAVNPRRPNQAFGQIRVIQNDETASYQALNVIFRQNLSHGITSLLSYTWSHALDVSTDSNNGGAPMDPFNWKRDYSNANWDVRHRFVASYTYDLPFFRSSSNALVKYGLANWQVNGITTVQTGFPFNVVISGDIANNGLTLGNQRPNIVGKVSSNCGQGHLTNCISVDAFAYPAPFTYGNAARNILRGPDFVDFDFSLFKNFPIRERSQFQLRGEIFNLFNHPSFANPSGVTLVSPDPNVVRASTFGSITSTATNSSSRQIQLAAKFTF